MLKQENIATVKTCFLESLKAEFTEEFTDYLLTTLPTEQWVKCLRGKQRCIQIQYNWSKWGLSSSKSSKCSQAQTFTFDIPYPGVDIQA